MSQLDSNSHIIPPTTTTLWADTPVPAQKNFQIDTDSLHQLAAWLFQKSVSGVAINTQTGRGPQWAQAQRSLILETWAAHRPPGKSIIASIGAPPDATEFIAATSAARDEAQQAAELGANAILIHPPKFLDGDDQIWQKCFAFHQAILESVQIPGVISYKDESAGGLVYPNDLLDDLLTLPQIMGIQAATTDSVIAFQEIAGLLRLHSGKKLLSGADRFLGYSLMAGATAALTSLATAFPEPIAAMLTAWQAADHARFHKLAAIVDSFAQTIACKPLESTSARLLATLVHQGVISEENAHDPFGPGLQPAEFAKIGTIYKVLRRRFDESMNS